MRGPDWVTVVSGPASGRRMSWWWVVPASARPCMRVSVGLGVSEVRSDPVRDRAADREEASEESGGSGDSVMSYDWRTVTAERPRDVMMIL